MTAIEVATLLNGREMGSEINKAEERQAKDAGLVVVFGYSDDNVELRGAIHDELGAYNGTVFRVTERGLLKNDCDNDDCPYFEKSKDGARSIVAVQGDGAGPSWRYTTDIPHSTFEIMEDGEVFAVGIVFRLADAQRAGG